MHDALGQRIKQNYEDIYRIKLPRRQYVIVRIDGKAFHTYLKSAQKPFDHGVIDDMANTALKLCQEIQGAKFAYTQSDEINIVVTDFDKETTTAWFDNNLQKIVSVSASIATAEFNKLRTVRLAKWLWEGDQKIKGVPLDYFTESKFAQFDSRAFVIADRVEVLNLFEWRQQDMCRNSIQMLARSIASDKECHDKNTNELQELVFQKSGQNWNDLLIHLKRGLCIYKKDAVVAKKILTIGDNRVTVDTELRKEWIIDKEIPIFHKDWGWFDDKIPKLNN